MLDTLSLHYQNNKLAHAYLIVGDFDQILPKIHHFLAPIFCRSIQDNSHDNSACTTCKQISRSEHPHIILCRPQGRSLSITVDMVRELLNHIQTVPLSSQKRFVIISDIQKMTKEAINSFLKTLEEPPSQTVFITQTTSSKQLLPTLLSRMRVIQTHTSFTLNQYPYLIDVVLSLFSSSEQAPLELVQSTHEFIKKDSKTQVISVAHYLNFIYQFSFVCIHNFIQYRYYKKVSSIFKEYLSTDQLDLILSRYSLNDLSFIYEKILPLYSFLTYSPSAKSFLSELFMTLSKK